MLHFDEIKKLKKIIKFINYVMTEQESKIAFYQNRPLLFFLEKKI